MVTPLTHKPLITPVAVVFASSASDNDPLKDSDRKRPQHQALATEFSATNKGNPGVVSTADYTVTLSNPVRNAPTTILTYSYNPLTRSIGLEAAKP